jgi:alpha/beta superfamily hydrolase
MVCVMVQVQALDRQWRSQGPSEAQQRLVLVGHSFGSYIANLVRRGV